jgi:hypothetical protein
MDKKSKNPVILSAIHHSQNPLESTAIMPNKLVTAVTLPVYIQYVSDSNLSQDTDYPHGGILMYSSVPPDKYQDNTSNLTKATSFHFLSDTIMTKHPTI